VTWQHIALQDAAAMPWKNGGGMTRELLAWPPGVADWHWRISVAQVDANGPFSLFEGVQRWFAVLDGAGVQLALGQGDTVHMQRLTSHSDAFCFDGAVPADCTLIDGSTQDFNLMVRRKLASASLQRVRRALWVPNTLGAVCAVWAGSAGATLRDADGQWMVPAHTLAWAAAAHAQQLHIDSVDALYMEIVLCL